MLSTYQSNRLYYYYYYYYYYYHNVPFKFQNATNFTFQKWAILTVMEDMHRCLMILLYTMWQLMHYQRRGKLFYNAFILFTTGSGTLGARGIVHPLTPSECSSPWWHFLSSVWQLHLYNVDLDLYYHIKVCPS